MKTFVKVIQIIEQHREDKKMHDYGLNKFEEYRATLGWRTQPYKKVTLTNVWIARNRITVDQVAKRLEGLLVCEEFERKLSYWLVKAIVEAIEKGEKVADITQLFSCEMEAEDSIGKFILRQEHIQNMLMNKLFVRCSENDKEFRVKLNWKVLFWKN